MKLGQIALSRMIGNCFSRGARHLLTSKRLVEGRAFLAINRDEYMDM